MHSSLGSKSESVLRKKRKEENNVKWVVEVKGNAHISLEKTKGSWVLSENRWTQPKSGMLGGKGGWAGKC